MFKKYKNEYNFDNNNIKNNESQYISIFNNVFNFNFENENRKDKFDNTNELYIKLPPNEESSTSAVSTSNKNSCLLIQTINECFSFSKKKEIDVNYISPICHEQSFSLSSKNFNFSKDLLNGKKRGRKKKGDNSSSNKNKFSIDNQINKFKTTFYQKFIIEMANILKNKYSKKTDNFKKINKKVIKDLNIKKNLNLLNSKIEKLFSYDISDKYYCTEKKANQILLDEIKNLNNNIKLFFNTKIDDLYKIFINKDCINIMKKKYEIITDKSLYYYLDEINDINYRNNLEKTWKNIYSFFDDKKIKNQENEF